MIEKVKVLKDQNIVDLALQEYGSVEGLVALARRNGVAVDGNLVADSIIEVDTTEIVDNNVTNYYKRNNLKIATGQVTGGKIFDDTFDFTFE